MFNQGFFIDYLSHFSFSFQTVSSVQAFFLAMALYPEVQRRAQAEIDAVVGKDRLPDFSDRDALPYVNALVKETMRWNLVIPMGTPSSIIMPMRLVLTIFSCGSYVLGR